MIVKKFQFGTIHCVCMAALQVARQVVDPDFPTLGDPDRRLVSVDVSWAAQLRGSPTANFESNHSEIWYGH